MHPHHIHKLYPIINIHILIINLSCDDAHWNENAAAVAVTGFSSSEIE